MLAAVRSCLLYKLCNDFAEREIHMQNEQKPSPDMVREYKLGNTTYVVKSLSRPDAAEDAVSKIKRLIQNDLRKSATTK